MGSIFPFNRATRRKDGFHVSKLISSLSLSYSSQRLIDSMLKRKVAIGRSPFSRDKIIGWLGGRRARGGDDWIFEGGNAPSPLFI